jgi:hypothetical protein
VVWPRHCVGLRDFPREDLFFPPRWKRFRNVDAGASALWLALDRLVWTLLTRGSERAAVRSSIIGGLVMVQEFLFCM